ncbi:MAG: hypothetical protein KKD44_21010 [Proteobacteria bacterium]|nr:hypothetical protein [Pseudomonadota bacterium]
MYIARTESKGKRSFSIRTSYLANGVYLSRELMDLGPDPGAFVRYPHGRSFYLDALIEETLRSMGEIVDYDNLERIFWPFIRPHVRQRYERARSRDGERVEDTSVSGIHMFDKRRMSYLRTGSMNQQQIDKVPGTMFRFLSEKSRDELEQRFMADERSLSAKEIKSYVFVIFDLQRHFNTLFAREMPQALDQDRVADHLLSDICALNRDTAFWAGMTMGTSLHDYLIRYLIMFFDTEYQRPRFLEDLESARMNRRRYHRQTILNRQRPGDQAYAEASAVFGLPVADLKAMTKRDIQRLYRKKARDVHPDQGGSHELFIRLSGLYEELLALLKP